MKRALIFAALLAAYLGCAATAFAQQIGSYPYAATPLLGTEQMVGNQAAKYPCVGCTVTITPAMIAGYTVGLAPAYGLVYNNNGAPAGIIPSAAGQYCLDWPSTTSAPTLAACSSSMVYPGAGIPISTGTAWGTSITPGTGVDAALGVDTGSAGSFVVNGGALGTPSSGVGTNITGVDAASVGGYTLPCTVPTMVSGDYLTNNGTDCSWGLPTSMFSIANASGQATAVTNYYGDGISSSTDAVGDVLPQAAVFTEMTYYQATAAAGSGTTVTFYSGAPGALAASTALTCTVAVGANSCSVSGLQSVAADDMWLVGVDNAGTASTGTVSIGLSYQ